MAELEKAENTPAAQGHPVAKFLEFAPIIAFLATMFFLRGKTITVGGESYDGFVVATALFVPIFAVAMAAVYAITGKLSQIQIVTFALVIIMGTLTVFFNDERFFKMKPTIIYMAGAAYLGIGVIMGKAHLKGLFGDALTLDEAAWMQLTRRAFAFCLGLAALNEVVWRNTSSGTWATFKFVAIPLLTFVFFAMQAKLFEQHFEAQEEKGGEEN